MTKPVNVEPQVGVHMRYTNHRGETAWRTIVPIQLYFGATEYHTEFQWLLEAFDVDKNANRTFAMRSVHEWRKFE